MEAARNPGPGFCCKPGGRLDMSHGFVHHIRRNQIARLTPITIVCNSATYQKAWHLYDSVAAVNPGCEEYGESSSGGSELEPSGRQLFCLEYEADSGEVTSVIVYQDDDPGRVSEEVSAHTPLDAPMREALKLRIQEEMTKRQSQR
ncbi:hypothetical protein H920_05972 [Fukomys damarensis]|uniref:Uncharacterized protein n=1 Tax=Fukomys damarensis TaxID=885580 RepID=A0A091DKK8_FUKDA|nr:hypothetical protein H920_05972 [Fukomys damarensis]